MQFEVMVPLLLKSKIAQLEDLKKKEESIPTVKFNISKFSMVQFNFDKSQNSTLKLCAQSKHTLHI